MKRNLKHIAQLNEEVSLEVLSRRQYKNLLVIAEVFRQQSILHETGSRSIKGCIVSISQPHVRPIVRGKQSVPVEFGENISASINDGFVNLDRIDWNPFNESVDLQSQVEN
ncbi:MAG: hypothetical protein HQM13_10030 [SAR324 cluster bacterium]|nr:hypothetical protein [SAR324 cluster bacterium]